MDQFEDPTGNSRNYKWGFFYVNSADPRIFVPKRYGFGYSLNFGKPYVAIGFVLILLIILFQAFLH